MPLEKHYVESLRNILMPEELIELDNTRFVSHSKPWSLAFDQHPHIVLAPKSVDSLARTLRYLGSEEAQAVTFAVRGRGTGSSSATDLIISMMEFQDVTFDEKEKVVEIGAGLNWGEVDESLKKLAPGFVVVGARCPYVGVTGSTLMSGFSWLSHELGLGSDPSNFLDAEIVLMNGIVVWASTYPDLLWALRGGGGNFGVVTKLRLRAHPYSSTVFSGLIFYPFSSLHALSRALAKWTRETSDSKTALHVFVVDSTEFHLHGEGGKPQLAALIFDGHGEEHGRSEEGFAWALNIEGADPHVGSMALSDVHELQRHGESSHGTACSWLQAALIDEIDDETLVRATQWYTDIVTKYPELSFGTFTLIEIMQEPAFNGAARTATGWPHGKKRRQHVLQLSVGGTLHPGRSSPEALKEQRKKALQMLKEAPAKVANRTTHPSGDFLPNFLLDTNDTAAIFAENWDKLRQIKQVYDPKGRLCKTMTGYIPPLEYRPTCMINGF